MVHLPDFHPPHVGGGLQPPEVQENPDVACDSDDSEGSGASSVMPRNPLDTPQDTQATTSSIPYHEETAAIKLCKAIQHIATEEKGVDWDAKPGFGSLEDNIDQCALACRFNKALATRLFGDLCTVVAVGMDSKHIVDKSFG
jgi:hypothetical protein